LDDFPPDSPDSPDDDLSPPPLLPPLDSEPGLGDASCACTVPLNASANKNAKAADVFRGIETMDSFV
jgi:hypothetical protein